MNKVKIFFLSAISSALFILYAACLYAEEEIANKCPVTIEYFFQQGCSECEMIKNNVIPKLEERYNGLYNIKKYDTGIKDNFLLLASYQDNLNTNDNKPVYMVINQKYMLAGYKRISADIYDILDSIVSSEINITEASAKAAHYPSNEDILYKKADKFKTGTVALAGLIDGINPCVFSTLVFFLSLLTVSGVKGVKLLLVGTVYCVSCFVTYLAIGIGVFKMIKFFAGYHPMQITINAAMTLLLVCFAFLSFRDALRYRASGTSLSVALKLPQSLQTRIHSIIRRGLSYKYLIPSIFFIGMAVTVIESVCTGQVYVPTLAFLTQGDGVFSKWFLYLILYNIMFIIPLIFVFIAAYSGIKTFALISWSKKNLIAAKIILGIFFILMAVLMAFTSRLF